MKRNNTKQKAIRLMLSGSIEEYLMYLKNISLTKA